MHIGELALIWTEPSNDSPLAPTGEGFVWPMSIITRALTSDDDEEILDCLATLKRTTAGTGEPLFPSLPPSSAIERCSSNISTTLTIVVQDLCTSRFMSRMQATSLGRGSLGRMACSGNWCLSWQRRGQIY